MYNANNDLFDLEFSFVGTGIAKIHVLNDKKLNIYNKLKSRKFTIKNFLRKLFKFLVIKKTKNNGYIQIFF